MSFFEALDRVREKPEHVRQKIVLVTSLVLTGLIFVVWISSFTIPALTQNERAEEERPGQVIDGSFVKSAVQNVEEGAREVGSMFFDLFK